MKIKLQDYSLISNQWIDERIKDAERLMQPHMNPSKDLISNLEGKIIALEELKLQLISSEKLANKSFEAGEYCEKEKLIITFDNPKGRFLNSEIEIL